VCLECEAHIQVDSRVHWSRRDLPIFKLAGNVPWTKRQEPRQSVPQSLAFRQAGPLQRDIGSTVYNGLRGGHQLTIATPLGISSDCLPSNHPPRQNSERRWFTSGEPAVGHGRYLLAVSEGWR
jgi:hypothetical protein